MALDLPGPALAAVGFNEQIFGVNAAGYGTMLCPSPSPSRAFKPKAI
jgi:hypothetical protein